MKKLISMLLILSVLFSTSVPVFATTNLNFYTREIYGYEGKLYLTIKENTVVRDEPHNQGVILNCLPKGYPLEAEGMYQTSKGTMWIKLRCDEYESEAWCFIGNLKEHTHNFINLENYGYGSFEFCDVCGHIRATSLDAYDVSLDDVQIALACMSLIPGIGNGFDILDSMISLIRGNYFDALLSLSSAIPGVGSIGNALKLNKHYDVYTDFNDMIIALEKVDGYADVVKVRPSANYYRLRKSLDQVYASTGDLRFYKLVGENIPKRSVAAHHIVAIGEKASEEAANILMYLGIDLNGATNGVYLCMRSDVCEGTLHVTKHSPEYYDYVNQYIGEAFRKSDDWAEQRVNVIRALDDIARRLMSGDLSL